MLLEYKVEGYKSFINQVNLVMKSYNKIISNKEYVVEKNGESILKSAAIYGPNNTGKSSFLESFMILKNIVMSGTVNNKQTGDNYYFIKPLDYNLFKEKKNIIFTISFISNNIKYEYELEVGFDSTNGNVINNEKLYKNDDLILDRSNNQKTSEELIDYVEMVKDYKDKLLITSLPNEFKNDTDNIISFFDKSICILNTDDFGKIYDDLSSLEPEEFEKFKNVIRSADINLQDIYIDEKHDYEKYNFLKLVSKYKCKEKEIELPSYFSDSDGTKVFMDYIINVLKIRKNGGILIVDEIDKSLHTFLTKSIISLFNNENNDNCQLIFTTHDLMLLDTKYLFRKDQIWFTERTEDNIEMYSMKEYKDNDGARNDALNSYLKGLFGALPFPDIEDSFYEK